MFKRRKTLKLGEVITYNGPTWTEPAGGTVVDDTGLFTIGIRVCKPYKDPEQQWVNLRVPRRFVTRMP